MKGVYKAFKVAFGSVYCESFGGLLLGFFFFISMI